MPVHSVIRAVVAARISASVDLKGIQVVQSGQRRLVSAMAIMSMGVVPVILATGPISLTRNTPPPEDDYGRMRRTDLDTINRMGLLLDAHFDFDSAGIRDVDRSVLARDAEILRKFDFLIVTVQGHCDERGTMEYNLTLGERRAKAVRDYLVSLRVQGAQLKTASYGEGAPVCPQHGEECWMRNRRAHLRVSGKAPIR